MASKKKVGRLPRTIWLTSNNLDAIFEPGRVDDMSYPTKKEAAAEAKRMTDDGYPSHVVGPYILHPGTGRRHV